MDKFNFSIETETRVPMIIDWSGSRTLPSESWKNPIYTIEDRLKIADGAVSFRDDVIKHLREQLKVLRENQK